MAAVDAVVDAGDYGEVVSVGHKRFEQFGNPITALFGMPFVGVHAQKSSYGD